MTTEYFSKYSTTLENISIKDLRTFVSIADFLSKNPDSMDKDVAKHLGMDKGSYSRFIGYLAQNVRTPLLAKALFLDGEMLSDGLMDDELEVAKRAFPTSRISRSARLTTAGKNTAAAAEMFLDLLDCAQWLNRPIERHIQTFELTASSVHSKRYVLMSRLRGRSSTTRRARPWDYRSSGYKDPEKVWPRKIPEAWKKNTLADLPTPAARSSYVQDLD